MPEGFGQGSDFSILEINLRYTNNLGSHSTLILCLMPQSQIPIHCWKVILEQKQRAARDMHENLVA